MPGPYIVSYSVEASAATGSEGIDCAVAVNGTASSDVIEASHDFSTGGHWASIGGDGALTLTAGDQVGIVCSGEDLNLTASFVLFALDDLTQVSGPPPRLIAV